VTLALPDEAMALANLRADEVEELACKAHMGVWAERRRGFVHADLHWEWNELAMTRGRLAVCAPREHAKSETFTVNQVAWRSIYTPGLESFVFAETSDQAKKIKERIDNAVAQAAPWMVEGQRSNNLTSSVYANWASVEVAGSGKSVRGSHPDLIVGDDVLEEGNCMTSMQRKRIARWWAGTVGGMAHPPTVRSIGQTGRMMQVPGTIVHLVGTPFHQQDLLMSMRENPLYEFRRYAAEFDPADLVPGTMAVEVT
jgi:hypothetical protein